MRRYESWRMKRTLQSHFPLLLGVALVTAALSCLQAAETTNVPKVALPPVIDPGPPGGVPSDAIVLFEGKDLSKWRDAKTNAAAWKVENDYLEVVPGKGDIFTREEFG